jgi:hypothetical protein
MGGAGGIAESSPYKESKTDASSVSPKFVASSLTAIAVSRAAATLQAWNPSCEEKRVMPAISSSKRLSNRQILEMNQGARNVSWLANVQKESPKDDLAPLRDVDSGSHVTG